MNIEFQIYHIHQILDENVASKSRNQVALFEKIIKLQVLYFLLREKHKSYSLLEDRRVSSLSSCSFWQNEEKVATTHKIRKSKKSLTKKKQQVIN